MILNELHFMSGTLGMNTTVLVLIPQDLSMAHFGSDGRRFRVLWLLHGLSDDETIWLRRTSIERYAERYGICVVMPRVDRSFYCNLDNGEAYYDYVSRELPGLVTALLPVSDRREDNFVAGLSMGGYASLKLVLRTPEKFISSAAFSSVTDWPGRSIDLVPNVLGPHYVCPPEDDLYALADGFEKLAVKRGNSKGEPLSKPKIFMGCGTEDVLLSESRNFRDKLTGLGFDVTYRESAGGHSWEFWDEYIQYALNFFFG